MENLNTNENTQIEGQEEVKDSEKSYSQEDVETMLETRVSRLNAKHKKELEEAREEAKKEAEKEVKRLSALSDEEKELEESDKKDKELRETKEKLNRLLLENDTVARLSEEGIPLGFKTFLIGADAESTNENIKVFKEEYGKAIEDEVNERLKGKTPKVATATQFGETKADIAAFASESRIIK